MYPYVESICVEDGKILNHEYHQQRLERTFRQVYGKSPDFELSRVIKLPERVSDYKIKLRFLYDDKDFRYEYERYKPKNIRTLKIVKDDLINYRIKSTDRRRIQDLLTKKGDCDDILIIKKGNISDTSSSNICFYDGKKWLTPDTPLLEGTCRARLLKEGKIEEARIRLKDIPHYDSFCLINAMVEGFGDPLPISSIIYNS